MVLYRMEGGGGMEGEGGKYPPPLCKLPLLAIPPPPRETVTSMRDHDYETMRPSLPHTAKGVTKCRSTNPLAEM